MSGKRVLKSIIALAFLSMAFFAGLSGCNLLNPENEDAGDGKADLYVQFNNDNASGYTITCIELMAIGRADEIPAPSGEWTTNMLQDIGEIPPGGQQYFHAEIASQERCYYRLGIKNPDGSTLMLNDQQHYVSDVYPTLTHWGSDERTVSVTIIEDSESGLIFINGWSEWAGIE